MKNIKNSPKCPACFEKNTVIFITNPEDFEYQIKPKINRLIYRCKSCNSVFPYKPFATAELEGFYKDDYQDYGKKFGLLNWIFSSYTKYCAKLVAKKYANGPLLDYGCGHGYFLKELSNYSNNKVYGYDPVDYGNPLVFNSIKELSKFDKKFKYIRLNHVIEHLSDFKKFFNNIEKITTNDVIIFGQTPNASHFAFRLFKRFWGPLHYPYHTIIFSKKGLENLSNRNGYKFRSNKAAIAPTGWSLSIENFLKKTLIGFKTRGRLAGYGVLLLSLSPLSIIEMLLLKSNTSNMNFELEKNDH